VAEVRNQFHQRSKRGFLREADQWTLITDTISGASNVQHQWSYVDPFGHGQPDCGTSTVSVESFLMGGTDDSVKQKLRAVLSSASK
jgi:hypothetical protein